MSVKPRRGEPRHDPVRDAVAHACSAFTELEMVDPDEAGARAASLAFRNALAREASRGARRPRGAAAAAPIIPGSASDGQDRGGDETQSDTQIRDAADDPAVDASAADV